MSSVVVARTIVATLVAQGVEWVVLAPGSRNAPLSLAMAAAESEGLLRLHVRVDERSAGFVALGLAKASQKPVAVVTTSGTAVGNLLPAVMEARHSGVPLVVLSADRPASMINSGASQTTNQLGTLAGHVLDVARVSSESGGEDAWAHQVVRSVALAAGTRTRQPGPVQLNVELGVPLVGPELREPLGRRDPVVVDPARLADPHLLPAEPLTVVLAGDASPARGAEAVAFAEAQGLPLLAEPSSNARRGANAIATYRLLLAGELGRRIERVVVFGHPTLSRPVTQLLSRRHVELIMVADHAEWVDPGHRASVVCDAVIMEPSSDPQWLADWQRADADQQASWVAGEDVDGRLAPSTAHAAIWQGLSGGPVVLGSSNPIRDADLLPIMDSPAPVYANRGLAGIDGTISTATGIALASGEPTTVLLGDLTFLHDLTALVFGDLEQVPDLRVVVVDDHGGSIFHGLEQGAAEHAEHFERVFGTPQRVDPAEAARGLGVAVTECSEVGTIAEALAESTRGLSVVVVRIDRSQRPRPRTQP